MLGEGLLSLYLKTLFSKIGREFLPNLGIIPPPSANSELTPDKKTCDNPDILR
jgi:hypothetical protein